MTVEEAVRSAIVGNAGAAAIFGTRVYPGNPPDNVLASPPWIAYRVTDEQPMNNLEGLTGTLNEMEFDVLCATYSDIRSGVNALVSALNTHRGGLILRAHWNGTEFLEVQEGHFAQVKFIVQAGLSA